MKTEKLGGETKVIAVNGQIVGSARKEKNVQIWLESAQVKVLAGDSVLNDKAYEALERELKRIVKNRTSIKELKSQPVSDFTELQLLADGELKTVTQEGLASEAQVKANRKKASILGGATKEQSVIIDRFYGMEAKEKWNIITQVRAVLALVNGDSKKSAEIAQTLGGATKKELVPAVAN